MELNNFQKIVPIYTNSSNAQLGSSYACQQWIL